MRHYIRAVLPLAATVLFIGAAAGTCPETFPEQVPSGNWGGEHAGMVVADTGATIEYDCAAGRITEPLRLDGAGNFTWAGVHIIGLGGPIRMDQPPIEHPARYTGHASATTMQFTVEMLDTPGSAPMTFTVKRGANPHVFKCL